MKKIFTLSFFSFLVFQVQATIHYTQVNDLISQGTHYYDIDLDGDDDFSFEVLSTSVVVHCLKPDSYFAATGSSGDEPKAYSQGAGMGTFHWQNATGVLCSNSSEGLFTQAQKYLVVKFSDGTNLYQGWFYISGFNNVIDLLGYAYNDVPDEPITAGQTSTGIAGINASTLLLAELTQHQITFQNCETIDKVIAYTMDGKKVAEIIKPVSGHKYTINQASGLLLVSFYKEEELLHTAKYFVN